MAAVNKKYVAFARKYRKYANAATRGTKIFPDTVLAAAALESGYGQSKLTKELNNFFGIKGTPGKVYRTREIINGKEVFVNDSFRSYKSPFESFQGYVKFIQGDRYVKAGVLKAKTPAQQIAAIKKAGYATDPNYVSKLVSLIKSNKAPVAIGSAGLLTLGLGIWIGSTQMK